MDIFYDYIFWIMIFCLAFHLLDENICGWQTWINRELGFNLSLAQFYSIHLFALVLFCLFAVFGWMIPVLSLSGAAALFIDGLFFHIFLSLRKKSLVPGTISAFLLLVPISVLAFNGAVKGGVPLREILLSIVIGFLVASYPVFILSLNKKKVNKSGVM